jgi:DNA-binding LytR/AlgR family response regulator
MQMPMLKIMPDGTSRLVLVDLNDVAYIKIEKRNIVYHTIDDQFNHISTLSELEEHLSHQGFDLLDKTNLVNMSKIKKMDDKHGNIYFEEEPTKDSKFASVAFIKQKLFKEIIAKAIGNNTGAQTDSPPSKDAPKKSKPDPNAGTGFEQFP